MHDFIHIQDAVFDEAFCSEVISFFENMSEAGFAYSRKIEEKPRYEKDDTSVFVGDVPIIRLDVSKQLLNHFHYIFWNQVYPIYSDKFDILNTIEKHGIYQEKIQKTKVGGGYHVWHCESGSRGLAGRILVYNLYLNTVDEGGETEFLYYPKRVKAETGRFLLFPAGFTHTHRGNPPISNDKYIITGWVEM